MGKWIDMHQQLLEVNGVWVDLVGYECLPFSSAFLQLGN
jgi:hypothetical protein